MGIHYTRLRPEEEYDMRNILVARYRYYIDPTTGKVYKRGDSEMPPGCRLLVGEGSPVEPNVAEQYGIETEEAQDVARVRAEPTTAPRDRGLGVGRQAEEGYRRIEQTAEVHRELAPLVERAGQHGAGAAAQLGLHAETTIAAQTREAEERGEAGTMLRRQQIGAPGAGSNEITKQLEAGEREALARHRAEVEVQTSKIKEEIKAEPEDGGGTAGETAKADPTGSSNEAPASVSETAPPPPATSRTREIKPAGGSTRARGGAKGRGVRGAKGGSKGSTGG